MLAHLITDRYHNRSNAASRARVRIAAPVVLVWGALGLRELPGVPYPRRFVVGEGGRNASSLAPSVVSAGAVRRLGKLGRAPVPRSGGGGKQRASDAAAGLEKVEGALLDQMRNEEERWDTEGIIRACIRAAGFIIQQGRLRPKNK